MASGSSIAVYSAIIGNSIVMVSKFVAFVFSGSSAMLSEAIHSFADVSNQCLLALGIQRAKKRPTKKHPYGYSRERYIWALISAIGIFFLGCGVTVYHGINVLLHPKPIQDYQLIFSVLILAFFVEGAVLIIALKQFIKEAKEKNVPFFTYFIQNPDPIGVAVILEDSAAVLGVFIASVGIGLSWYTGNFLWDGIATIAIGILLGVVAVLLIYKSMGLLVGRSINDSDHREIIRILKRNKTVSRVHDLKSTIMGINDFRFKAEIDFNGRELARQQIIKLNLRDELKKLDSTDGLSLYLEDFGEIIIDNLGLEVNKIENSIRKKFPDARHIDLETD